MLLLRLLFLLPACYSTRCIIDYMNRVVRCFFPRRRDYDPVISSKHSDLNSPIVASTDSMWVDDILQDKANYEKKVSFSEEEECPICFMVISNEIFVPNCGHWFHTKCLRSWIAKKGHDPKCPVCTGPVDPFDLGLPNVLQATRV